ncbi:MAG: chromosome segregation protein SMC [bacterium]
MYLKEIRLNGFKSFYSDTHLTFPEGITCIVGPNGCGKSNVHDAVRWVLGEQSAKQLRGDHISDVISAGNVRRAQKREAEAYLTFGDTGDVLDVEGEEIEIGRKVNQDGEGTYYLNGEEVRLKDIQDLFRDTGIGQDLYSIIGQGEVQRLVDSKPEERREIIEEAAGIATFRHRRDLTRRRLDQTSTELEQVEQELQEKRGRLSQLKGQAEKARKVRELKTELRSLRTVHYSRKFNRLVDEIDELEEELENADETFRNVKEEKQELQSKLERHESMQNKFMETLRGVQEKRRHSRERYQEGKEKLSRLETKLESTGERIRRQQGQVKNHLRRSGDVINDLTGVYQRVQQSKLQKKIHHAEVDYLESHRDQLKSRRNELNRRLDQIRDRTLFELNEESELKNRLQRLEEVRDEDQELRNDLHHKIQKNQDNIKSLRDDRSRHFMNLVEAEHRKIELALKRETLSEMEGVMERMEQEFNHRLRSIRQSLESSREQKDTLKRYDQQFEGMPPGVRQFMKESKQDPSEVSPELRRAFDRVHGTVANILSVPRSMQAAVETSLGDRMYRIVVDDRDTVELLLEFIRERVEGRVVFQPLDSLPEINQDRVPPDCSSGGLLGRASQLVSCEIEGSNVLDYFLGDVIIAEELEVARRYCDQYKEGYSFRVVTLQGEVVATDGTFGLGSEHEGDSGVIGRSDRIDRLQQDIRNHRRDIKKYQNHLEHLEESKDELRDKAERINNALQGIRSEYRKHERKLGDIDEQLQVVRSNQSNDVLRMTEVIERSLTCRDEKHGLEEILENVGRRETQRRRNNQNLRSTLEKLEQQIEQYTSKIREVDRRFQESRSRVQEQQNRVDRLHERLREMRSEAIEILGTLDTLEQEKLSLDVSIARARIMNRTRELRHSVWGDIENEVEQKRHDLDNSVRELNRSLNELSEKTEKFRGERSRIRQSLDNEQARLDSLRENIREELDIEPAPGKLSQLRDEEFEEMDGDELRSRMRSIKSKIQSHEPVNMLAEKEASSLEEEVSEIANQKEDLEESCERLEQMIKRLNRKAREQFKEAFEEIQGYFEEFIE